MRPMDVHSAAGTSYEQRCLVPQQASKPAWLVCRSTVQTSCMTAPSIAMLSIWLDRQNFELPGLMPLKLTL